MWISQNRFLLSLKLNARQSCQRPPQWRSSWGTSLPNSSACILPSVSSSLFVPLSSHLYFFICWLTPSGSSTHLGALTDGRKWQFYLMSEGEYYYTAMTADTHQNIVTILGTLFHFVATLTEGLLTLFCAGQFPTTDSTKATWIAG